MDLRKLREVRKLRGLTIKEIVEKTGSCTVLYGYQIPGWQRENHREGYCRRVLPIRPERELIQHNFSLIINLMFR
jgi:hypothetical protein